MIGSTKWRNGYPRCLYTTIYVVVVAFFSVNSLSEIEHINLQSEISRSGEMNKALIESETKANRVELTSRRLRNRTR